MSDTGIGIEDLLTQSRFTVPIDLELTSAVNGKKAETKIVNVTYEFGPQENEKFRVGVKDEEATKELIELEEKRQEEAKANGEKVEPKEVEPVYRRLSFNEQLSLLIREIDGVQTGDEAWWGRVRFRYRTQILEQVWRDIYPNAQTSKA